MGTFQNSFTQNFSRNLQGDRKKRKKISTKKFILKYLTFFKPTTYTKQLYNAHTYIHTHRNFKNNSYRLSAQSGRVQQIDKAGKISFGGKRRWRGEGKNRQGSRGGWRGWVLKNQELGINSAGVEHHCAAITDKLPPPSFLSERKSIAAGSRRKR